MGPRVLRRVKPIVKKRALIQTPVLSEVMRLGEGVGVDSLGEELGEAFLENVTGADDAAMEHRSEEVPEEVGGPFVITTGETEFSSGLDASNPAEADHEALPTVRRP